MVLRIVAICIYLLGITGRATFQQKITTIDGETAFKGEGESGTQKVMATIDMATACSMAPAAADKEAMKALLTP